MGTQRHQHEALRLLYYSAKSVREIEEDLFSEQRLNEKRLADISSIATAEG